MNLITQRAAEILYSRFWRAGWGGEAREFSGLVAVKKDGELEVYSGDGKLHYGNLREDATDDECRTLAHALMRGVEVGKVLGREEFQAELRKLLGVKEDTTDHEEDR